MKLSGLHFLDHPVRV